MRNKILKVCMVSTIILGVCSPASAAQYSEPIEINSTAEPVYIEDLTNEYDYIVEIREANKNSRAIANVSAEEIAYVTSDAIENELLSRSKLSTEVLRDYYCYTDEAIAVLREYDGERLEDNPDLRAVSATYSSSLGELVKSDTRVGAIYSWSWSSMPLFRVNDYVAMSWEGTYVNGGNNNMAFDTHTSFSNVNYYNSATNQEQVHVDFESDNLYHGAAIQFPMEDWFGGCSFWAKSGSIFVYTDLVNDQNGPRLYEQNTHAEYAHFTYNSSIDSVSFPAGISINIEGDYETKGSKNIRIQP